MLALAGCTTMTKPTTTVKGALPELDYFVGRWHADARDPSTGNTFTLEYRVEPALRGQWYIGTGISAVLDLEIHDLWGRDVVTGELVRTIFDSAQTSGTVRSSGWSGDTLVFEGEAVSKAGRVTVRETIQRKGPDEFHAVWEAKTGETWTPYSVEVLRRQR